MRFESENIKSRHAGDELSGSVLDESTRTKLREKDALFLSALFLEVNPYLGRVCIASGIYSEAAKDIIQDTWAVFFTDLSQFEGRSQVRTYLCGILFNKIREHRRIEGRTIYEEDSEKVIGNAFTPEGWWKSAPSNPSKIAELSQLSDFVKECLEGLSEQQKAAFIMREVEEEDSAQICNILSVTVTNLRVLLFRAKDKLRKCIEGKTGPQGESFNSI